MTLKWLEAFMGMKIKAENPVLMTEIRILNNDESYLLYKAFSGSFKMCL